MAITGRPTHSAAMRLTTEIRETRSVEEVVETLQHNGWAVIAAAPDGKAESGALFVLGYVGG